MANVYVYSVLRNQAKRVGLDAPIEVQELPPFLKIAQEFKRAVEEEVKRRGPLPVPTHEEVFSFFIMESYRVFGDESLNLDLGWMSDVQLASARFAAQKMVEAAPLKE